MTKKARDVMTPDPACCTPGMSVDEVAQLMIHNDCGEIPVIDTDDRLIGVVTDRDIVCRVVAEGKNPVGHTSRRVCLSRW
jgi:CBS domain-containing protein